MGGGALAFGRVFICLLGSIQVRVPASSSSGFGRGTKWGPSAQTGYE